MTLNLKIPFILFQRKFSLLQLIVLFALSPFYLKAQSSVRIGEMRCEYMINPQGIDEHLPRLSWVLQAIDPKAFGQRQTAYRIMVSASEKELIIGHAEVWDSNWINSDETNQILYRGKMLESDRTYFWKVCVKDENQKVSAWSKTMHWSTGLFNKEDWTARWIGTGDSKDQDAVNMPDPWFRKTFDLKVKPGRAKMFVASVGYHELYVNGKKIGNGVLAPAVSDHSKRARYISYDISSQLQPGKNIIALWLGTSWSVFSSYKTNDKPLAPIVIAQGDIYDSDKVGTLPLRIQTDKSWKTASSPNSLLGKWEAGQMGGELWDAGKENKKWNLVDCDETNWKQAVEYRPRLMLTAQMVEPNQLTSPIKPVAIEKRTDGSYRVDMGVNFAGWTKIKLTGDHGQRIDMLFSEREGQDMTFNIHNVCILAKDGKGTFENRFNYSSGRWITIKGLKKKPKLTDIEGWVVKTAYQSAATFSSSDSLQNWIYAKTRWNFENLSLGGYVVDCPQRERLGYGGDAHATSETGMYNYHLGAFYTKWMEDWRDVQGTRSMDHLNYGSYADDGILPHTAPTYLGGGGPGWGGIVVVLPWLMYQQEGDERVLEKNFGLIKKWLSFLDSHTKDDLLSRFGGGWDFLGDWLWPNATAEGMNNDKPENICFNNAYRVYNLRTAAKIARVLKRDQEANRWESQADASAKAIHEKYFNPSDNSYADQSMGNLAIALLAEIPPVSLRESVMKRLEKEILIVRKGHIHAGITGGALLFKLLRNEGRDDLIYSMTAQTDYPGWGYMKASGATSLWEMWEKDLPGHSMLHSSFLYPGAWYINGLSGIRKETESKGFKEFVIRVPLLKNEHMSWVKASYEANVGTIKTEWQRRNGQLILHVVVPPNSTATVYFPAADHSKIKRSSSWGEDAGTKNGYSVFKIPAGAYTFSGEETTY
ncbi:alpha-L-rhamnosidase [Pedobacter sp. HMWF019]|uniref:family 78 glycoside hydrolase catalytic domain n=1 Tax=Pedobacter sp. HMWF019 TaxID=2056856 RepID=UPI000D374055|nr:family 78 glycoside hydrolase catalytic domain [Pedobacter sp. HMWF019]PTT02174.1 alpha-L-rhamnosidase [Pedobacter sp. HMWF019]